MKILIITLISAFTASLHATETKTLLVVRPPNGGATYYSETIALAEGDRAELVGASPQPDSGVDITVNASTITQSLYQGGGSEIKLSKIVVAGPATIQLKGSYNTYATFDIQRVGAPSNPVAIPQEAGSNFNVILEQSSDLVNWTPANPGTYTGTETKRFFRTRIVKLP